MEIWSYSTYLENIPIFFRTKFSPSRLKYFCGFFKLLLLGLQYRQTARAK